MSNASVVATQATLALDEGRGGEEPRVRVVEADAVDFLRSLPRASVDLLITDPAYESLEKHRARGTTTRLARSKASSNPWFEIFPNSRFPELFRESYRVLRRNAHLYLFCDPSTLFVAKPAGEAAGFTFWKPIVWNKGRIGMGYHYRCQYEFILFFEKGKLPLADLSVPDVLEHRSPRTDFPTEKPVELLRVLVEQSSQPGQLVVDPFVGSGSTGEAALLGRRRFAGSDVDPETVSAARARLDGLTRAPTAAAAPTPGVRGEA